MYRVAGVATIGGRVLVHQFEGEDDFCVVPGGRVEMREPAEEALAREMREELGCDVRVGRLLWVIDNLFLHRGRDYHELGLYFEITLPEGVPASERGTVDGHRGRWAGGRRDGGPVLPVEAGE